MKLYKGGKIILCTQNTWGGKVFKSVGFVETQKGICALKHLRHWKNGSDFWGELWSVSLGLWKCQKIWNKQNIWRYVTLMCYIGSIKMLKIVRKRTPGAETLKSMQHPSERALKCSCRRMIKPKDLVHTGQLKIKPYKTIERQKISQCGFLSVRPDLRKRKMTLGNLNIWS
jgi:hypothetical protein